MQVNVDDPALSLRLGRPDREIRRCYRCACRRKAFQETATRYPATRPEQSTSEFELIELAKNLDMFSPRLKCYNVAFVMKYIEARFCFLRNRLIRRRSACAKALMTIG